MTPPIAPGTVLDQRYLLTAPLPDRGLGENWAAQDTAMKGRVVAVKFLRALASPEMPDGLARHLLALRPIRHRCLLAVINHGVWGQRPYLVHEHFPGRSLGTGLDEVRAGGQLVELPVLRASFDQVCEAVRACHEAPSPVLHLGLNPGCVLMHRQPKKDFETKVIDVGLHPWADRDVSAPARSARGLESPAPELFNPGAGLTVRTDVFALGALLREMISLPASLGETLSVAGAHRRRDDVPEEVWATIEQCVELDPARRFADIPALRAALNRAWTHAPRRRDPIAPAPAPAPGPGDAPPTPSVFERLRALESVPHGPASVGPASVGPASVGHISVAPISVGPVSLPPAPGMTLLRASDPNPWDVAEVPGDPFGDQSPVAPVMPTKALQLESLYGSAFAGTDDFDGGATVMSHPPDMADADMGSTVISQGSSPFARGSPPTAEPVPEGTVRRGGPMVKPTERYAALSLHEMRQVNEDPRGGTLVAPVPRGVTPPPAPAWPSPYPPPSPGSAAVAPRSNRLLWGVGVVLAVVVFLVVFAIASRAPS